MKRNRHAILTVILLVLLFACSRDHGGKAETPKDPASEADLTIMISLPGDDFPSGEVLAVRQKVASLIQKRGVGVIMGTGGGMGMMKIEVHVRNRGEAEKEIEAIMKEAAPGARYFIK